MTPSKKRPPQSLDELTTIIKQLLSTWAEVYQGGDSFINFEELGPRQPGGLPLNAAAIRRWFQSHPHETKMVKRRPLDSEEAFSFFWLEARIAELRHRLPTLVGPVLDVHLRSTAGHRDADWALETLQKKADEEWELDLRAKNGDIAAKRELWRRERKRNPEALKEAERTQRITGDSTKVQEWRERAEAGDWEASNKIWLYDQCIQSLAVRAQQDQERGGPDLYATSKAIKKIRDEEKKDERDEGLYEKFLKLTDTHEGAGLSTSEAYRKLTDETGFTDRYVRDRIAEQRIKRGGAPRKRGRPPKDEKKGA